MLLCPGPGQLGDLAALCPSRGPRAACSPSSVPASARDNHGPHRTNQSTESAPSCSYTSCLWKICKHGPFQAVWRPLGHVLPSGLRCLKGGAGVISEVDGG